MTEYLEGPVYLTLRRDSRKLRGLVPVKATKARPQVVDALDVVVRIHVRVPKSAFDALSAGEVTVEGYDDMPTPIGEPA